MTIRISPTQRNLLRRLEIELFVYNSEITEFKRRTYEALERKGLISLVVDDNGEGYWELKIEHIEKNKAEKV